MYSESDDARYQEILKYRQIAKLIIYSMFDGKLKVLAVNAKPPLSESFPGGKAEHSDRTIIFTLRRELLEELQFDIASRWYQYAGSKLYEKDGETSCIHIFVMKGNDLKENEMRPDNEITSVNWRTPEELEISSCGFWKASEIYRFIIAGMS